jgi:hypothetical protein
VPSAIRSPVIDDTNPVGKLLGFFHVMRGIEHGHALVV